MNFTPRFWYICTTINVVNTIVLMAAGWYWHSAGAALTAGICFFLGAIEETRNG